MNVGSEGDAVESLLLLKSTPFRQGEKVLAYLRGRIHEAEVLEVDSRRKRYLVHYQGSNQKSDKWVGVDLLMKHNKENLQNKKHLEREHLSEKMTENLQNKKHLEREHLSEKMTKLHPENPNVTRGNKRKTMSKGGSSEAARKKANEGVDTSVFGDPELLKSEHGVGASKHFIPGWSLTNDANLLDPDNALDFINHVVPAGTKARLSTMPDEEFWKAYHCNAVENFVYMTELANRLEARNSELKQCKSQVKDMSIEAARLQKELADSRSKVKEVQVERSNVIKGATQAEAARAQAETQTCSLRKDRLELLGRVSQAEAAKMQVEDEAAALKEQNLELLKKLAESEAPKMQAEDKAAALKAENLELLNKLAESEASKEWLTQKLTKVHELNHLAGFSPQMVKSLTEIHT